MWLWRGSWRILLLPRRSIGPRTLEQLTGSLRAVKIKFTKADMQELDAIWPGPGGEAPEAFAW